MSQSKRFGGAIEKALELREKTWNKMLPDHLSMEILRYCMYVHQGKDEEDKLRRFNSFRKELTTQQALWVMSLLMLERVIDLAGESDEAQGFYEQFKNADKETRH